jgi:hypothetical protein
MGAMYCTNCDKEIPPFDATLDTRAVPAPGLKRTRWAPMWLCADCAKSREAVKRTLLWAFALFFIVLATLALIGGLFTQWR